MMMSRRERKKRGEEERKSEMYCCGFPKGQAQRSSEWLPSSAIIRATPSHSPAAHQQPTGFTRKSEYNPTGWYLIRRKLPFINLVSKLADLRGSANRAGVEHLFVTGISIRQTSD